ncbi:MAG TPA: hypothetical protein VLJ59_12775 [Mycobacteriales bacterium]|nr:hypothetical protein [Mycobacteriales bacterium]
MAVYIPQARRRRRLLSVAAAALVVGAVLGALAGRLTAPTPEQRVAAVQEQARQVTSQLRVLSLHSEAGAASLGSGDGGAALALQRADTDLGHALDQATWIPPRRGAALRDRLHALERAAGPAARTASFATDTDALAADIDTAFGLTDR